MAFDGSILYQLASDLGMADLSSVTRGAGVMSVLQVSVYYVEPRIRHSVARVIEYQLGEVVMQLVFEGVNRHRPLELTMERDRFEQLIAALRQARFDKLQDQAGLSYANRSLWLIQRAAGAYSHGIIVSPSKPQPPYSAIVNAIDAYLPAAIREVPLRR